MKTEYLEPIIRVPFTGEELMTLVEVLGNTLKGYNGHTQEVLTNIYKTVAAEELNYLVGEERI